MQEIRPNLTECEWNVLNKEIEYKEAKRKAASVLRYIKKHILLNDGAWKKSFANILAMYNRYHTKMSLANFKKIVSRLKDLKLLTVQIEKKTHVYTLPVAEKVAEKVANQKEEQSVDITTVDNDNKKLRYGFCDSFNILNTEKNIINYLKKFYKGVKSSLIATKKQLRDIVQALFVAKGMHSNNSTDRAIQYLVFKKIKHSNQKINLVGAVSYLDKVIEDRISAFENGLVEVPAYITGEVDIRFKDFGNTRNYDDAYYENLEKQLLGQ